MKILESPKVESSVLADLNYNLVTITKEFHVDVIKNSSLKKYTTFTVKVTQDFNIKYEIGHYRGIITNPEGHILHTFQSPSAVPDGKINEELLNDTFKRWYTSI